MKSSGITYSKELVGCSQNKMHITVILSVVRLGIDGRIILKCILHWVRGCGLDSCDLE
jgi:hypothetical protein